MLREKKALLLNHHRTRAHHGDPETDLEKPAH